MRMDYASKFVKRQIGEKNNTRRGAVPNAGKAFGSWSSVLRRNGQSDFLAGLCRVNAQQGF